MSAAVLWAVTPGPAAAQTRDGVVVVEPPPDAVGTDDGTVLVEDDGSGRAGFVVGYAGLTLLALTAVVLSVGRRRAPEAPPAGTDPAYGRRADADFWSDAGRGGDAGPRRAIPG